MKSKRIVSLLLGLCLTTISVIGSYETVLAVQMTEVAETEAVMADDEEQDKGFSAAGGDYGSLGENEVEVVNKDVDDEKSNGKVLGEGIPEDGGVEEHAESSEEVKLKEVDGSDQISQTSAQEEVVRSGVCGLYGNNLNWQVTGTEAAGYELTISGTGAMQDYSYEHVGKDSILKVTNPWADFNLNKIILTSGVTSIGAVAFANCKAKEIVMPETIIEIGEYAFAWSKVQKCSLPKGITIISDYLFMCSNIENLVLPEKVKAVGKRAFYYCDNLQSITFGEDIYTISEYAFAYSSITNVVLPKSLTTLEQCAFGYCNSLKSIFIPSGIIEMGYDAFADCTSLEEIEWEHGTTFIDGFRACTSLQNVVIPQGVVKLKASAFNGCTSLQEVVIPNSVTAIEGSVFTGCSNLKEIILPESISSVGWGSFYECTSLKKLLILNKNIVLNEPFARPRGSTVVNEFGDVVIYGHKNSTAEAYANKYQASFSELKSYSLNLTVGEGGSITPSNQVSAVEGSSVDFKISADNGWEILNVIVNGQNKGSINNLTLQNIKEDYNIAFQFIRTPTIISTCSVTLSATTYTYNGSAKVPTVTVKDGTTTLTNGTDYTVSYSDNTNAGTATVTISGIGNYSGLLSKNFTINKASPVLSFQSNTITKQFGDETFTNTLEKVTDGTVTYSSSNSSVATVVSTTGIVTIKGAGTATITATAAEGKNYLSGQASYVLTVNNSKADLTSLTYSFSNSRSAFGYSSPYQIPLSSYQIFFNDTRAKFLYNTVGTWGGNCYGMASTSGMFNTSNNGVNISGFNSSAAKVKDLKVNDNNSNWNLTLLKFIEAMQVSQYDTTVQECYSDNTDLNSLCNSVNTDSPTIIAVFGPQGGHALVGYKINKISSTKAYLYVYDCNYPNQERYITLTTNSAGSYTGWYYYLNDTYEWGSSYNKCEISYVPYSVYQNVWANKSSSVKQNVMSVNSNNFEIQDYAGNVMATVHDGELSSSSDDIYQFKTVDLTADGVAGDTDRANIIYLPTDVYQVKNVDPSIKNLEVGMVNIEQSLSVETTASSVVVAVDDDEDLNTVSINAKAGESYSVELNSTLQSAQGMEEIKFSGKGTGSSITVGMDNGNCILSNCTGINMWINGEMVGSNGEEGRTNISKLNTTLEYASCVYDGANKEPKVVIENGSSTLKNGADYVVIYNNNIEPGTAAAKVYGIGKYTGTKSLTFTITKKKATLKFNSSTVTKTYGTSAFTNKLTKITDGKISYKSSNTKVATVNSTGKVTIKGVGTAKITASAVAGKNYNTKSASYTLKVNPKGVSISKVTARSKGFAVKWTKQKTQTTGYQIQYSISSKFAGAKTVPVGKNTTVAKTVSKLKAEKKYYVRIRTYKTVSGKKYYSSWSKAKTVTTKK